MLFVNELNNCLTKLRLTLKKDEKIKPSVLWMKVLFDELTNNDKSIDLKGNV